MEEILLGDIAQIYMGLTFRRYLKGNNPSKERIITYSSLKANEGIQTLHEEILGKEFDKKYYAQRGDILMKTISPNDAVCVTAEEGSVVGDKIAIIRLKDNINPEFVTYLLNSSYVKKQLHRLNDGRLKNVSLNDIKRLKMIIPNTSAQLEYINILKLIDEKIKVSEEIIEASKDLRDALINGLSGDE